MTRNFCQVGHRCLTGTQRVKQKQKFASKVLVWLALSSEGISQPYIGTTKGAAQLIAMCMFENVYQTC